MWRSSPLQVTIQASLGIKEVDGVITQTLLCGELAGAVKALCEVSHLQTKHGSNYSQEHAFFLLQKINVKRFKLTSSEINCGFASNESNEKSLNFRNVPHFNGF